MAHPQVLDDLEIFHSREDLVLDLELCLHAEAGALLDGEGLVLEGFSGAGGFEVDDDVGAAFDFETEGEDDAFAGVVGVGEVLARAQAEGFFPFLEGFVVLVWRG
jgi:hypothetical protein